jgi:hypothetical protein
MEMSVGEAGLEEVRRARAYALEHGTGLKAALAVIREDDPVLFRQAHPRPEQAQRDESQPARAARHMAEREVHFIRTKAAKTRREATLLAVRESPEIAKLAGVHPDLLLEAKNYAGPAPQVPLHGEAKTLPQDVLVRQIAASALKQGVWRPGPDARERADFWFGQNFPAPPAGSGKAVLDSYNGLREKTVDQIIEDARRLMADPAERKKLHPAQ